MEKKYTTTIPKTSYASRRKSLFEKSSRNSRYRMEGTHSGDVHRFYNSPAWKNTRMTYLMSHPVDELMLLERKTLEADQVHHLVKFHEQTTEELRWMLLTDPDNLISLNRLTHESVHMSPERLTDVQRSALAERKDALMLKYAERGILLVATSDSNVLLS